MDVFFNHLKEQEEFVSDVLSKVVKMNLLSKRSTRRQRIATSVAIVLNMTKLDIMITLLDVTLDHTVIDANYS